MFVANRMAKNPVTVSPDTPVDEAASAMKKGHFRRLPVVEDGKLVGFLSDKDIMRVAPSPARRSRATRRARCSPSSRSGIS